MSNESPELTVGPYTEKIREAYIYYRRERYLIDHPGKTIKEAGRAARSAWRNKVKKGMATKNDRENGRTA